MISTIIGIGVFIYLYVNNHAFLGILLGFMNVFSGFPTTYLKGWNSPTTPTGEEK